MPAFAANLTSLNVSNNALTTLKGQGLAHLRALKALDLRFNMLPSLEIDVLPELEKCAKLEVLFLVVRPSVQRLGGCTCCHVDTASSSLTRMSCWVV